MENKYIVGNIVGGVIDTIHPFGFFIKINEVDFGLLKIVNIPENTDIENNMKIGMKIKAIIIEVEFINSNWKINLSMLDSDFHKFDK